MFERTHTTAPSAPASHESSKADIHCNALRLNCRDEFGSAAADGLVVIKPSDLVEARGAIALPNANGSQPFDFAATVQEHSDRLSTPVVSFGEPSQLREQYGRLQFAQRKRLVAAVVVDLGSLKNVFVRRHDRASATRRENFAAAETENPDVAPRTGHTTIDRCTLSLASVFDDLQVTAECDVADR